MTNEPASGATPLAEPKSKEVKEEVQYDDFGLPIRKPRPRTPIIDSDDEDEEEQEFKDAVETTPRGREITSRGRESTPRGRERVARADTESPGTVRMKVEAIEQKERAASEVPPIERIQRDRSVSLATSVGKRARAPSLVNGHGIAERKRDVSDPFVDKVEKEEPIVEQVEKQPIAEQAEKQPEVEAAEKEQPVEHKLDTPSPPSARVEKEKPPESKQEDVVSPIQKTETPETTKHADTVHPDSSTVSGAANGHSQVAAISEYSHHQIAQPPKEEKKKTDFDDLEWQTMPAFARYDMYDDDNRLIAKENEAELEDMSGYGNLGGAAKGYTRVIMDDDAESQTSMDDNTAYLFKEKSTAVIDEDDEAARDPLAQMQTTKDLLTEGQRIAYVGLVRLAMVEMAKQLDNLERTKGTKKIIDLARDTLQMWSQKMMVRVYSHMDIDSNEQIMIEQLSEHGVVPPDLTPALMQNARVKNPAAEEPESSAASIASPNPDGTSEKEKEKSKSTSTLGLYDDPETYSPPPPPYEEHAGEDMPAVQIPSQLPDTKSIDIDLRWTILCDLFLVLIADSVYDARSRQLLEQVGKSLSVDWLDICRFEKRVTDALEMQEEASKENWNEDAHMENRRKAARNRRIALMGLATVGGSLVIGLSAGLMAPVIGAGLAAGFTTIGITGTTGFFAGAGSAAIITTTGVLSGGTVAVRAAERRTGAVKTFEYRPLHNNKRVNLIITVAGWMNGKVDDVRLPYSTVDPVMGDLYSILWEPDMLRSMGDTINILATEALTQGLQQVLGSTILTVLMGALQLPLALTKLSYLIDNPWIVSQARADMAGLILADSLIDRNLGSRPITLVGFSLGSRVIFTCLKELAKRGAFGIIQNVYMFGTPVVAKKDEYTRARAIVSGRFVNGYAQNDWILGYLFRATSGGIMRVAGLAPVEIPGVENINVTEYVPGHMAYRAAMPRLLREVGWMVESDEFTEIEDPDPENHEQRQRELINEIEEARKELEKKPEKKGGFSFFRKKKVEKKAWEVYDENTLKTAANKDGEVDPAVAESNVMFDIDAIKAEVAALSAEGDLTAEGIEVKEIPSTLPPMKIDIAAAPTSPYGTLRGTKSYNDSLGPSTANGISSTPNLSTHSNGTWPTPSPEPSHKKSFEEYDEFADDGHMSMTFDTSFKEPLHPSVPVSVPPPSRSPVPTTYEPPAPLPSWDKPSAPAPLPSWDTTPERLVLKSHTTEPNLNLAPSYNAWADEFDDDFGMEKEVEMKFE